MAGTVAPPSAPASLKPEGRRFLATSTVALLLHLTAWASLLVPLVRAGLADVPATAVVGPDQPAGLVLLSAWAWLPPGFAWVASLVALATIGLGPVLSAGGAIFGGAALVDHVRAHQRREASIAAATLLGWATALVLALSPWGQTAKLWFFE